MFLNTSPTFFPPSAAVAAEAKDNNKTIQLKKDPVYLYLLSLHTRMNVYVKGQPYHKKLLRLFPEKIPLSSAST